MSFNTIPVTIIGNLTDAPEMRYTPSGVAVAKVTVASTPRTFDKASDGWKDGEPTFMTCTLWRSLAENASNTLDKGTRVIVTGKLRTERWKNDKGEQRSRVVMDAEGIGPDLTYAVAAVKKMIRNQGDPDDPWATASKTRPEAAPVVTEEEPPF